MNTMLHPQETQMYTQVININEQAKMVKYPFEMTRKTLKGRQLKNNYGSLKIFYFWTLPIASVSQTTQRFGR